jgi:lipopolysaccharide transport system ATP-binding protein
MTDDIVIKVKGLSKCYHIYEQPSDRLLQMLYRGHKRFYRELWALKDVSFELRSGETVGIIGRNGSGKSTLLQMLCGTVNPTSGSIETKGRIAALLELGSGFNPDFTGRENIYLNASILGLSREETTVRYGSIVDYSEIGEFIDQPVKTYSSGMIMRLAFAVAIQVDPDILIVDEALSVGDERFQRKCFSHIEAIRNKGATILFVSHSSGQIVQLCDRSILLDAGEILEDGNPKQVVAHYQKLIYAPEGERKTLRKAILMEVLDNQENSELVFNRENPALGVVKPWPIFDPNLIPTSTIEYSSHGATIHSPSISTLDGQPVNNLLIDAYYNYNYIVDFYKTATDVRFGMMVKSKEGIELGGASTSNASGDMNALILAGSTVSVSIKFQCRFNPGTYFLNAGVLGNVNGEETYIHRLLDAAMFLVLPAPESGQTGMISLHCQPNISIQEPVK